MFHDTAGPLFSRRGVLLLGGIAAISGTAGCGGSNDLPESVTTSRSGSATPATPPSGVSQVNLNFDSGALGHPVSYHVGASVSSAYGESGEHGCRLEPRRSNGGRAALVIDDNGFPTGKPWAAVSIRFRLVTPPRPSDGYMNLFEIGNTATHAPKSQFTVYFKHDTIVGDFDFTEHIELAPMPAVGTWHTIDVVVGYGETTYRAEVRFDGGAVKQLRSRNDKSPQSVKTLWIHYPNVPVDYTLDIDRLQLVTTSARPQFLPAS